MKLNKYLKELGLTQMDMPNYYNKNLAEKKKYKDKPGADFRNKENKEGFSTYEFFNLDRTLDLFVYSKLCYYREHIAELCTPGHLVPYSFNNNLTKDQKEAPQKLWLQIVDDIIEGFRISIVGVRDGYEGIDTFKIKKARRLLAEHWDCFWY